MKEYHVKTGPFLTSKNKISRMMKHLLISLIPIILFSFYKNGIFPYLHNKISIWELFYPLLFIAIGPFVTYLTEWIGIRFFYHKDKNEAKEYMKNSYAIFPGLFLVLILPIHTPIWIVIFGAMMATIIGKLIYGGFGNNIFNPALIGRLLIITIFATTITKSGGYFNSYEMDTISKATPLSNVALQSGVGTYSELVKPYGTLTDFFTGMIPGAVGETSAALCLLAFIYLSITKVIKWKIPVFYISTVFIMTFLIGYLGGADIWYPFFQILSGGLFFGAIFMATDPVTSPVTSKGQIIYGILLGVLTVVFRYLTPYPEGVLTSILTMNLFVFMIDQIGLAMQDKKVFMLIFSILFLAVSFLSYQIGNRYMNYQEEVNSSFHLLESKQEGNKWIYIATEKGNGGIIKARITLENDKITQYEILEQKETPSYYQLVENCEYRNQIIENQDHLNELDTVSGATISSTALKKLAIHVLEDYKKR